MPQTAISAYLERLPARQAEVKLMLSDAVSYPHMKKGDRQTAMRQWMKKARSRSDASVRPASPGVLKLLGIGVGYVE